ncbi:hypothetical protein BV22DRAFT_171252 [Leucogyrophana mollusca]|uniref:Uncharacterized protein n=1 Tax=Leucogyrophana mollusca TaxID=85980 RepID=A0ACB8BT76_9AGAM|nr:hypothetical protein BV22DRAFT_171252 [Leucogyrophana mollusca]
MLIRLLPTSLHPTILYTISFPTQVPNLPLPPAWSAQLHLLTSVWHLEPPSNIHALDKSAWLVAVVHEVLFDLPSKAVGINFVDGLSLRMAMPDDCARMLEGVVEDVKNCDSEEEGSERGGSVCPSAGSCSEDTSSTPKPAKPTRHKKQRSLLFSLIASLVPRALPPAPPPTPTTPTFAPPPPLPQMPIPPRPDARYLRQRARATLVDAWRLHVLSALAEHAPAAGYAEWALRSLERTVRSQVRAFREAEHSRNAPQNEGRNALDLGDRDRELERRWRAPSPFPERADEWGVRRSSESDIELDAFEFELAGESILHESLGFASDDFLGFRDDSYVFDSEDEADKDDESRQRRLDTLMEIEAADDGEDSEESEELRTPEEGEVLPLPCPSPSSCPSASSQSAPSSSHVSRTSSTRPRARAPVIPPSSPKPAPQSSVCLIPQSRPTHRRTPSHVANPVAPRTHVPTHLAQLTTRLRDALVIVRSRACQEGWGAIRGSQSGYVMDESEKVLEDRARRRAWSAGIQIADGARKHPSFVRATGRVRVWDGSLPSPSRNGGPAVPPGLAPPPMHLPLLPLGLSLGRPMRSSPLARFVYSMDDIENELSAGEETWRYGALGMRRGGGEFGGKRPVRMSVSVQREPQNTRLFPVTEEPETLDGGSTDEDFYEHEYRRVNFPADTPSSPTSPPSDTDEQEDDPFFYSPFRTRTRTTSMHVLGSTSPPPLPMFRPSTPPPSYQASVEGNEGASKLDASALLFQPLSSFRTPPPPDTRPPLVSNPPFIPNRRARANSLPSSAPCQDLSQAYAAPPPSSPPGSEACFPSSPPTPTYAHVQVPVPMCSRGGMEVKKKDAQIVFERGGEEFTLGIEVALGRAEEGRAVPVGW